MSRENESAILDSARVHLVRLIDALERGTGPGRTRRTLPRMLASLVLAGLICAACVGYSYVANNLDSLRNPNRSATVPVQQVPTPAGPATSQVDAPAQQPENVQPPQEAP